MKRILPRVALPAWVQSSPNCSEVDENLVLVTLCGSETFRDDGNLFHHNAFCFQRQVRVRHRPLRAIFPVTSFSTPFPSCFRTRVTRQSSRTSEYQFGCFVPSPVGERTCRFSVKQKNRLIPPELFPAKETRANRRRQTKGQFAEGLSIGREELWANRGKGVL